ncbi:hypothetical protein PAPHI01_1377 [Pancytospora philotis]|nr:hypothetical protein PAPHI01_1377 [Pancytospora philotis]
MFSDLFTTKEVLRHDLGYCRLYDIRYSRKDCTKMYFTGCSPAKYAALRSCSHPNILPVYKTTVHSIYTKRVVPFSTVYDSGNRMYNEYVLAKLREALAFLHGELGLTHGALAMDALFVDGCGNVLVGKFDRCEAYAEGSGDEALLDELAHAMLGKGLDAVGEGDSIFRLLEDRAAFEGLDVAEKRGFIERVLRNKAALVPCVAKNIIGLLIDDVSKSSDPDYKIYVLDSLIELDRDMVVQFATSLFSILDTPVRLHLLRHLPTAETLGDCAPQLCLGLRVKEKQLKHETVRFLFVNEERFSGKTFAYILKAMQEDISDTESVALVCALLVGLRRDDVHRPVYKLLAHYLALGKARKHVYDCLDRFFVHFNKYKISTELLPLLCSYLSDAEAQDSCFALVERILCFLKENKTDIQAKDWSLKGIKGMFGARKGQGEVDPDARILQLSQLKEDDDWGDEDVI